MHISKIADEAQLPKNDKDILMGHLKLTKMTPSLFYVFVIIKSFCVFPKPSCKPSYHKVYYSWKYMNNSDAVGIEWKNCIFRSDKAACTRK